MSHPARGAWIEINLRRSAILLSASHPARGAWIEILKLEEITKSCIVAPRKGCVD